MGDVVGARVFGRDKSCPYNAFDFVGAGSARPIFPTKKPTVGFFDFDVIPPIRLQPYGGLGGYLSLLTNLR